jgi:hypothetical protein
MSSQVTPDPETILIDSTIKSRKKQSARAKKHRNHKTQKAPESSERDSRFATDDSGVFSFRQIKIDTSILTKIS